jgi:prepilin-type N-terminal cleavage/methylation domain-containing protein
MRSNFHSNYTREDGFTLIELLIGMAMALLVTAAAVTFLISVMHREPKTTSSSDVIGNARSAVEKITADLRVGESATLLQPSELKMTAECSQVGSSASGKCEVTYLCVQEAGAATYECVRSVSNGPTATVIKGLASGQLFCVYPTSEADSECGPEGAERPLYVGLKVELPNYEESEGSTVLEGGAALHNSPELLAGG